MIRSNKDPCIMVKLATHAKQMRQRVFREMLRTRGWKYRAFLRYLQIFKYVSFAWNRGGFLESYYTLMRYLDDIVDGDAPIPAGFSSSADYILDKIIFSRNPVYPSDEADYLMLHCFQLADRFGEDFSAETEDILRSLLFDAGRRGKWIVFPREELEAHFHRLDIRGTIRATLKIFKEDPSKYILLDALGTATRYHYDLEDFEDDIRVGYVNIPAEDCNRFGIDNTELMLKDSPAIEGWKRYHARKGLYLLQGHDKILPKAKFSWLARATFPLVYERPARRCFNKVLNAEGTLSIAEKQEMDLMELDH